MSLHANSLANLRPAWRSGQSGNPIGKPKGVRYPAEYLSELVDVPPDDLRAMLANSKTTCSKRIAIRMTLTAAGELDDTSAGEQQRAAADIMDRTTGKAQQTIRVDGGGPQPTLVQIIDGKAPRAKRIEATRIDGLPT